MAWKLGMKFGVPLDLTAPASDGIHLGLQQEILQGKAMEIIDDQQPLFLILSPVCTPYSNIRNLNMRTPAGKAKVEAARR